MGMIAKRYVTNVIDWMKRQDKQIIQTYYSLFDDELTQAETWAKNGDYDKAAIHAFIARTVNDHIKTLI